MADFETFILCVSWNSSQMCTYFCKDLVTGYCLCLVKGWLICKRHLFPNWFYYLVAMDLTSHETGVYLNAWGKPKETLNLLVVWSQLWIKSTSEILPALESINWKVHDWHSIFFYLNPVWEFHNYNYVLFWNWFLKKSNQIDVFRHGVRLENPPKLQLLSSLLS